MRARALDLFCCQGGATRGLQQAGFHVTGVDMKPQPRYIGDAFHQADALTFPLAGYDFIWASPPCQAFTALRPLQKGKEYPNLIPATRARLAAAGVPYAIENVEGAPLGDSGYLILLCGTMFGLGIAEAELRRHRLFETSFSIPLRPQCHHGKPAVISVHGDHARDRRRAMTICGKAPQTNAVRNKDRRTFSVEQAQEAMGIGWMSMAGLSQAIPPAYAEFIGRNALDVLAEGAA